MSSEENKEIAHRILRDVLEQRNLDAVEELYAADAVEHSPMRDFRGHEEIKESLAETLDAFSDYTVTVEDMIAEGDTVAARLTERGVHDGELMGIEPTGNEFEHQTMAFLRLEDGKVAEWWVLPDNLSFLQQLGVVESPGE
ncbi:DUF4440 domain-containing protein [Halobellus sp. Atlit-38R]|jgi:steroid delta-isomerase-like uncharacterized protein|uniref:ester cyclase n=1 Tax=Halobellus sp. Atlit-38R TaxID=2282131 RepID=UPI000EF191F3|nr:ester cyclase [Halobellus sp. Atlit-38R]RLM90985.1 DUF4440 domain-containing protein [Halobellus sp. Atlit-38R]